MILSPSGDGGGSGPRPPEGADGACPVSRRRHGRAICCQQVVLPACLVAQSRECVCPWFGGFDFFPSMVTGLLLYLDHRGTFSASLLVSRSGFCQPGAAGPCQIDHAVIA
jgi:hypothetical protein